MKHLFLVPAALIALAALAFADVRNGETYRSGGDSVTVRIRSNPVHNTVDVTYSSAGQSSGPHVGTPGANGGSATDAPASAPMGGHRFRIKNGRMEKTNDLGQWVHMGRPRRNRVAGSYWVSSGDIVQRDGLLRPDEVPLDGIEQRADPFAAPVPVKAFDTFPFDGWFGDDVTTLPDDPWEVGV